MIYTYENRHMLCECGHYAGDHFPESRVRVLYKGRLRNERAHNYDSPPEECWLCDCPKFSPHFTEIVEENHDLAY